MKMSIMKPHGGLNHLLEMQSEGNSYQNPESGTPLAGKPSFEDLQILKEWKIAFTGLVFFMENLMVECTLRMWAATSSS